MTALQLSAASYAPGDTVQGSVTFGNPGGTQTGFQRALITLRPPGGTHGGGPYDDLSPALGATTLDPGATAPLTATFALPGNAPTGTWEAYATFQDLGGNYQDGPSVYFTVGSAGTTSGSTGTSGASGSTGGSGGTGSGGAPYSVSGTQILDANGQPHLFHGIARPSLEWDPNGNNLSLSDYQLIRGWNANVVRLSLSQDFWLAGSALYSAGYAATVAQNVAWAEQAGLDVILDLHWSDKGDLSNTAHGQQLMADANSVTFWTEVANAFKGDPRVIFELYNEPHDIPWDVWLSGGATSEGWTAVGMQTLYDTVRATGATNLVIVGGVAYSADLSGVPTHRVQGYNIIYNSHIYPYPPFQPQYWDGLFGFLTSTDAVIATEFGEYDCGTQFVSDLISYYDAHNMSWLSWAWFPSGCAFPSIITDWSGTPSAMGVPVHDALMGY